MKTKTREAIFYAQKNPSGFFSIYVNGDPDWINASYNNVDKVRNFIDIVARNSGLNAYTLTFNKLEYEYYLSR